MAMLLRFKRGTSGKGLARPADIKQCVEFLPAALEIIERPASPVGRLLGWLIILLFSVVTLWAWFGRVDIVAIAEGKIIPSGRVKSVQTRYAGTIKEILVTEGQLVDAGQPLVTLDETTSAADFGRIRVEAEHLRSLLSREMEIRELLKAVPQGGLRTLDDISETPDTSLPQKASDQHFHANVDSDLLRQHWQDYLNRLTRARAQLAAKEAELGSTKALVARYELTLPLVTKRVKAVESLYKKGLAAETALLELRENQITQQQALALELANVERVTAEIYGAQNEVESIITAEHKRNMEAIDELGNRLESYQFELAKAEDTYERQVLAAPVRGYVQELAVHTVGGVVNQGETVMQIVPLEDYLEVEAAIQNKDIGFIEVGQSAQIKVSTFPFTRYGLLSAQVTDITADAVAVEKKGLIYKMRLRMQQNQLWVDGKWVDLLPGMVVTAEIKTGERRLIEYLAAPFLRYKDESFRER
jgi:hemolysin D